MTQPGAVVIGGYATGVSALRSLAREGVRTAVVLTHPNDIAHRSRYAHECHRVTDLHRRSDNLLDLLESQAKRWRGWALIPTTDYALVALAQNRELLSRWYPLVVPEPEAVRNVVGRASSYRLAEEVGLDVPRWYGPASRRTVSRAEIEYPVVVQPVDGMRFVEAFGRKLFVARNSLELITAVNQIESAGIAAEVFDLVPGPDENTLTYTVYLDRNGRPAAEFAFQTLRKGAPLYGVARAARPAELPQLREPTIALLQRIGWRGVASVEYKLDSRDASHRLIGINGRCFLSHALATRSGVNYPLLTWQEYALHQKVSAASNGWPGRWFHLHPDLLYTAVEDRAPGWSWSEFTRGYLGPWVDAVWSSADPAPFMAQCVGTLRKAAHEIREGREMETVRTRLRTSPGPLLNRCTTEAR